MQGIDPSDLDDVVERTEEVWKSLRGARIFATGMTGFYGAWLLAALAHARRRLGGGAGGALGDLSLVVLSRDPSAARAKHGALLDAAGVELVRGDVRSFELPAGTFTHVLHGATSASAALNAERPLEMFDVIVEGTRRVLELAAARGCARFLLSSSGAVYGPQPSSMTNVPETYGGGPPTLDARSAYAEGKRAAEHLCALHAARSGFGLTVARGFAFVGPHLPLDAHFAIGNFVRDALAGGPVRILGDGTPYRSYMYGSDLAAWLWTMLARGRAGAAYNVGSDDGRPLREIAERVAHAAGTTVTVAKAPDPARAPERYVPDTSLARAELGLSLAVPLDDAIRRTLAYHHAR
jgi:dTDP-glucose 4,6-dehydratase